MTETKEVFGRPIDGKISYYGSPSREQRPDEEFIAKLDAVFATGVTEVKWRQYTPYFNDGDACEFSVWGFSAKLDDDGGDDEDGWYEEWDLKRYDHETHKYVDIEVEGVNMKAVNEALDALEASSGYHETFLHKTFGDPAKVFATKEGFRVEFYEHD